MFFVRNFLASILLHLITASPQINLYLTDSVDDSANDPSFLHDCLHVAAAAETETDLYQIISYCLTQSSVQRNIQANNLDQKFTFAELHEQNITSQQLYLWSAPMDLLERYQFYLDQIPTTDDFTSIGSELFYNCTQPRFGPLCQYSLGAQQSHHSSLSEIIHEFYQQEYRPTSLTCYQHLQCDRGSQSMCLDWSEICDGFVDCRDGADEQLCWQLKANTCEEDEYQCFNGQCISKVFFRDDLKTFECLDRSDEILTNLRRSYSLFSELHGEPTFANEDVSCLGRDTPNNLKLTGSCLRTRTYIVQDIFWSDKPNLVSSNCWIAITCVLLNRQSWYPQCQELCADRTCHEVINETCPELMNIPASTLAFGHIFFAYSKEDIMTRNFWMSPPTYICYDDQRCDGFSPNKTLIPFNSATCRRPMDFSPILHLQGNPRKSWYLINIEPLYRQFFRCNRISNNDFGGCNNLTMYQCLNSSKCVSKYRLCDTVIDCDYGDDEECTPINGSCDLYGLRNLLKCTTRNTCLSLTLIDDGMCDCADDEYGLCEDEYLEFYYIKEHVSFPTICDGFTELLPITIDGRNETDETECQYWQCNNTYTRCNGYWNCFDGADEVDCEPSPIFPCPSRHHICVSPITNRFMCLPLEKANDRIIDCLGGTDEPRLCRSKNHQLTNKNFYCITHDDTHCTSTQDLCYRSNCRDESDQKLCDASRNGTFYFGICSEGYEYLRSQVEDFFCTRQIDTDKAKMTYFKLDKLTNSFKNIIEQDTDEPDSDIPDDENTLLQHCHRGLLLQIWLKSTDNSSDMACLCPPSFYGDICQYQNQRVSLTMQFQTFSHSRRTLFTLVVSLIDGSDERLIHSYHQITYLYMEHCRAKFNTYLLYSNRPKLMTRNYSIHIDVYEKISSAYRGSLLIPIKFAFLPVHRIAVQLTIPPARDTLKTCSDEQCVHGQCTEYFDDPKGTTFCRCDRGWTGRSCTIAHACTCSSDSLCVGVSASNRSICVCPPNKWGSRCLLRSTLCQLEQNTACQNGGQCISLDENMKSNAQFICICPKGYSGKRCEIQDNTIIISFHKDIILSQSALIHFIRVFNNALPENGSTYKTIPIHQNSITVRWSRPFHIAFAELFSNSYYLIGVQETYSRSTTISKTINPTDRCAHISEVLNETIVNFHLLRRIKYYHLPCQRDTSSLSCFYDENHFCLCNDFGDQRVANCFEFNHTSHYDCFGLSNCENGARCLQDRPSCPQTSICVCPKCFYGTRCQFSSSLFGLSLDAILGYHIQPHIRIGDQPTIVQVSVALTIVMFGIGLINGILLLIALKNRETRKSGSGLYLLGSSITTLFTTFLCALKFWILIMAQVTYMTDRSFLYSQCISLDFLLRVSLNLDQWFNACVAIERAITVIKGINFNKQESKQIAKRVITILIFLNISTIIHDPVYRRLMDDGDTEDEKRIWCIVSYPADVQLYNLLINIFHFFTPFLINLISSIIIIKRIVQQRTRLQSNRTYEQVLLKQLRQHSHLFLAPLLLTIFAVPRLIISFASGCMKSNNDSWLFLFGYLISFIPSTLTFVIFVLPSKLYKEEFYRCIRQYRRRIHNRVQPI